MKYFMSTINIAFLSAIFFISSGCSSIQTKVADDFQLKNIPVRVAVLPFDLSPIYKDEKETALIFRKVFYNYFSYLGYIDLDINDIDKILTENELNSTEEIYLLSPEKLGELLDVDALIYCTINRTSNITTGLYAETSIEAELKMVDTRTGSAVWEANSKEIDRNGILEPASLVTLIQKQIDNSKKQEAIAKVAEKCSNKIVQTIPNPASFIEEKVYLPEIFSLQTNINNNNFAGKGFLLEVYLDGEKGMKASFDIGNWKNDIPMQEENPGKYFGHYVVEDKDYIQKALVIGKLEDSNGLVSKKIYEKSLVWFDPQHITNTDRPIKIDEL